MTLRLHTASSTAFWNEDGYYGDEALIWDLLHAAPGRVSLTETGPHVSPSALDELGVRASALKVGVAVDPAPHYGGKGADDGGNIEAEVLVKHYGPGPHPGTGTDQSVHGYISQTRSGFDMTMSDFPQSVQDKIRAKTEEFIGTEEEILARLRNLMDQAATRGGGPGLNWYAERHQWIEELAEHYDLDTETVSGVVAAMSGGMLWEKNQSISELLLKTHDTKFGKYDIDFDLLNEKLAAYAEKYDLEFTKVDGSMATADITDPRLAAVAWYEISAAEGDPFPARYGYLGLGDSISLLRGGTPDDVLRGGKTRPFFNNLLNDPNDPDVTIDVQMVGAAAGRNLEGKENKNLSTSLINSPRHKGEALGVRPLIADYVRQITKEYSGGKLGDLLPRQVQAMIWIEFKDDYGRFGSER